MNYRKILLSALTAIIIAFSSQAKEEVVPKVHRDFHQLLQLQMEESQLFQAMVDSVTNTEGIDEVFELFNALDVYAEANSSLVDQYRDNKRAIPATAEISLDGFVAPIVGHITSAYGWRRRRMHKGEDIGLRTGDTVRASFDGLVRIKKYERRGYGYYYVLRHANGLETVYGHLSRQLVPEGAIVKAGQAIGLGGSTGRSTGPHLHFEIRYMGIALDPSDLIDFETFKPRSLTYHFDKNRAEWAQGNKGRRGATYRGGSGTSNNNSTGKSIQTASNNKSSNSTGGNIHRVKKGDTLSGIARRYGTTVSRLCKLNGIKANKVLQLGEKIRYK